MEEIKHNGFIITVIAACSLIVASGIISAGFKNIAKPDRTVSVRGLAEREVDADTAVWPLTFSLGGNDLATLQKQLVEKTAVAVQYLEAHGLTTSDYTVNAPSITDTSMDLYTDKNRVKFTYIAKQVLLVRSSDVAAVKKAQADSLDLAGQGIAVTQDYDSKVQYDFTGLNAIKPAMIAEATKNARLAAEQFAHDSGSKVGKIKTASQGLFSITDAATGLEEKKNVRVVTTVVYLLND